MVTGRMENLIIDVRINDVSEIPEGVKSVVIYCRVSTTHDSQESSLAAQLKDAELFAKNHNYFIIGIFVEKESGKSDINRTAYMTMLGCVQEFHPTYILSKSSDRIARSTEVESSLQRICRNTGTKIRYVIDGRIIDPNNSTDVMTSSFESAVNQAVSLRQHNNALAVNKRKWNNPWLTKSNECFGFRYDNEKKQMVVYEAEAIYVRKIFEKYVFEGMGTTAIAKYLAENGITGYKSNALISESGILKWLKNESYIGRMHIHVTETDFQYGVGVESKRHAVPVEEHIIVPVPRIIDDELFELAQELIKDKARLHSAIRDISADVVKANFSGKHLFAHKVFCGECQNSMIFKYTDRKQEVGVYKCSAKKKAKRKEHNKNYSSDDVISCENPFSKVREEMLIDVLEKAISCYASYEEEIYANLMTAVENVLSRQKTKVSKTVDPLKKELKHIQNEYELAKKAYMRTTNEDLAKDIEKECETLKKRITFLEEQIGGEETVQNIIVDNRFRIETIRNSLEELKNYDEIDRDVVMQYVDKILVYNDGKIEVYLKYNRTYSAILKVDGKKQSLAPALSVVNNHTQGMTEVYLQVIQIRRKIC